MPLPFRLECELTSQNPTISFLRLKEKVYVEILAEYQIKKIKYSDYKT